MKIRIQVVIDTEEHTPDIVEEIACIERATLAPETLGLTMAEAKDVLQGVQQALVPRQVVAYIEQQRCCPDCSRVRIYYGYNLEAGTICRAWPG